MTEQYLPSMLTYFRENAEALVETKEALAEIEARASTEVKALRMGESSLLEKIKETPKELTRKEVDEFRAFISTLENRSNPSVRQKDQDGFNLLVEGYSIMVSINKFRKDLVGQDWIEGIVDGAASAKTKSSLRWAQYKAIDRYAEQGGDLISRESFNKLLSAATDEKCELPKVDWDPNFDPRARAVSLLIRQENKGDKYIGYVTEKQAQSIAERLGDRDESSWLGSVRKTVYYARPDLRGVIPDFYDWYADGGPKASGVAAVLDRKKEESRANAKRKLTRSIVEAFKHRL